MTEKEKEVVAHRLQRARETLASAKVLEDSHFYFGAINRLYYACFYAVTALLATRELASSKHSGVMSLFNRHFVKTGIVGAALGEFYGDLFETRHEGDYADFAKFSPEEILDLYDTAIKFIDAIATLIEKEMQ
ncbi:MAG: HEPN domain-containing protein [candidate division KSB1 bacterium]